MSFKTDIACRTIAVTYSQNPVTREIEYHLGIREGKNNSRGSQETPGYYKMIALPHITRPMAEELLTAIEAQVRELIDAHAGPAHAPNPDAQILLDLADAGYTVTARSLARREAIKAAITRGHSSAAIEAALAFRRDNTDSEVQKAVLQNDIWYIRTEVRA